jgi:hypothetical protein
MNILQAPAAKAGLMCLGQVLAAVEPGAWPAAAPGFQLMISFLTDARPKVGAADSQTQQPHAQLPQAQMYRVSESAMTRMFAFSTIVAAALALSALLTPL